MKRSVLLGLVGTVLLAPAALSAKTLYAHDPAVVRADDGRFYLYATGTGVATYRSDDLEDWERLGAALDPRPDWLSEAAPGFAGRIWAPDITYRNGLYWLYYSASTFGVNDSAVGLAVSPSLDPEDPEYGWEDRGPVLVSRSGEDDWNAIDPAAFEDEEGGTWLAWGSFWSGIWIVLTDPATGKPAAGAEPVLLAARPDTPDNAIEAPFVFRRGKYYYLFVSRDYCCRGSSSDYNVAVGRSRNPDGPYRDRRGRRMTRGGGTPLLVGDGRYPGKGHAAVFTAAGGEERIAYHAYDSQRSGMSVLRVDRLEWDDRGWPTAVPADGE